MKLVNLLMVLCAFTLVACSKKEIITRELLIYTAADQSIQNTDSKKVGDKVYIAKANTKAKVKLNYPKNFALAQKGSSTIANNWATFKDDSLIERYLNRKKVDFVIGDLKESDLDQITSIDIMKALTEATLVRVNGLQFSKNFIAGVDPNELNGPYGQLGNVNSGGDNKNSFLDRPQDTILDPILSDALEVHTTTSVSKLVQLANKRDYKNIRKIFFQARIPVYYWLANVHSEQEKVTNIMSLLKSNNLYDTTSTTFKLLVIDQINQMGPGGVSKSTGRKIGVSVVIEHYMEQQKVLKSKQDVLKHYQKLGLVKSDFVFESAVNQRIDLKQIPEELLRFFLARVTYFSNNGPLGDFELVSNAKWLNNTHNSPSKGALHDIMRRGTQVPRTKEAFDQLDKDKQDLFKRLSILFDMD
ncbi:MAG: hypothetical protein ACRCXZ_02815 [Patescibacteria group bacterium]